MSRLIRKAIALILVMILTSANLVLLGGYTRVYALSDEKLIKQDSSTNHKNVEFNAYFEGGVHNKTFDINSESAKLYLNVKVKENGYLENGTIEFQNVNFKIKDGVKNDNIKNIDTLNNRIILNKLNNGSDITIELPIEILKNDNISLDYFNKETLAKFTAKYIEGSGKEKAIEKEVVNKISWKGKAETELNVSANKFIPFVNDEEYGVMVQTKLSSKVKNASLPIKNTNLEITVPTINNVKPTSVNVTSTKMVATNGKTDGVDFTNNNYSYDAETGKVVINTANLQDSISWNKSDADEYLVTYIYGGKEIYDYAKENGMKSSVTVNSKLTVYNNEENNLNKVVTVPVEFTETVGTITDFAIETPEQISKGLVYANYDAKEKVETEYYTRYISTVNNAKITKSIEFIQRDDKLVTGDGREGSTTVNGKNYAYNKRIEVSQVEFNKILGENGIITVKNEKGEVLGTINKEAKLENGVYSLDISSKNNNKLSIITTAPITEGQIKVSVVKALKGEIGYSIEQMKAFNNIDMELEGKANEDVTKAQSNTMMKEPELKAEMQINKKNWTTAMKNEDIEIRAVLDTSNQYNALYKNPLIQIEFPEVVEGIEVKNLKLLYTDELKIKESKFEDVNGKHVLNILLEGTQTTYNIGEAIKGINIVINANITLKKNISTQIAEVKMYYSNNMTNERMVADSTRKETTVKVNAIAQTGIVTENGMFNISDNTNIISTEDGKKEGLINTYAPKRTSTVYGKIVNSYNNSINNLTILGRVPAEGNKRIDTSEDLGSNMNLKMKSKISVVGLEEANCVIYYSENINATKDLEDETNGWTTTPSNLANVKSYLITTSDYEILKGKEVEFKYDVEIPENLVHEKASYQMYKVYYGNVTEVGTLTETKESPIIGVTTGEEPKLEVKLSSRFEQNTEVRERQIVKYTATITNTGDIKVQNVKLHVTAPDGTSHIKYVNNGYDFEEDDTKTKEIDVGNVEKGETKEVSFELKMLEDLVEDNEEKKIVLKVGATSSENESQVVSNEYTLIKTKGAISIFATPSKAQSVTLRTKDVVEITVNLENLKSESLNNVLITSEIPNGVTIEDAYLMINGDKVKDNISISDNKIQAKVSSIESFSDVTLIYNIRIQDYIGKLITFISATADGMNTHYSNEIVHNVENIKMDIKQVSDTPEYVLEGSKITYKFEIKNTGKVHINSVAIEDKIPEGLEFVSAKYEYHGQTNEIDFNNDDVFNIYLIRFPTRGNM